MGSITWPRVLAWRMRRQMLAPRAPVDAPAVARRLCGVQAQVASAAEQAVAARQATPSAGTVERALWQDRTLVKCWAMRGTLHLLAAEEHARYTATLATVRHWESGAWSRHHGVSPAEVERIREATGEVLAAGAVLTREELAAELVDRLAVDHLSRKLASGWGELLKPLSLLGELCHGPPRGNRVTFTSPQRWLAGWRPVDAADAGPALVRSFLAAHGPATVADFARWWARARPPAVRPWFRALAGDLVEVEVEGGPPGLLLGAGDLESLRDTEVQGGTVRLVPNFDQYVLAAARDLEALVPAAHKEKVFRAAGWISPVVLAGGRVAGVWRLERDRAAVAVTLFEPVDRTALALEADHLATGLGLRAGDLAVDLAADPAANQDRAR